MAKQQQHVIIIISDGFRGQRQGDMPP